MPTPRAVPTRAPLLSRIMKTMKVSNQLCSTILKQALRSVHHIFPRPWETSTLRQGQRCTQAGGAQGGTTSRPGACLQGPFPEYRPQTWTSLFPRPRSPTCSQHLASCPPPLAGNESSPSPQMRATGPLRLCVSCCPGWAHRGKTCGDVGRQPRDWSYPHSLSSPTPPRQPSLCTAWALWAKMFLQNCLLKHQAGLSP